MTTLPRASSVRLDLVGGADALGLPAQGAEIADARRQGDAAGHPVEEVEVVVAADELEELELRGNVRRRHHERRLLALPDHDARALLDDALFDDAARLHEADAQDLGARLLRDRAHDGGHLSGAAGLLSGVRMGRGGHGHTPLGVRRCGGAKVPALGVRLTYLRGAAPLLALRRSPPCGPRLRLDPNGGFAPLSPQSEWGVMLGVRGPRPGRRRLAGRLLRPGGHGRAWRSRRRRLPPRRPPR